MRLWFMPQLLVCCLACCLVSGCEHGHDPDFDTIDKPDAATSTPIKQTAVTPTKQMDQVKSKPSKQDAALEEFLHPKPSGLSARRQQQMYYDKALGENKNEAELDRLYPNDHLDRIADKKAVSKIVFGRAAYSAKLEDRLYERLMKRYHISYEQMCDINLHGMKEHWPLPPGSPEIPDGIP